jgi:hypothetical protein
MKVSAFTSARLTRDRITLARITRATITATRTNMGGAAGTGGIIDTITIRIPDGTITKIDVGTVGLLLKGPCLRQAK